MHFKVADEYQYLKPELMDVIRNFDQSGKLLVHGNRNSIRKIKINGHRLAIKSFKLPNFFNRFVYRFLRKSKARRSYEYGQKLLEEGILTPQPVAWIEERRLFTLGNSFYICKRLKKHFTFRELVNNRNHENWEEIIRAFTAFTHKLHTKGILFLDHSPGNTLIKKSAKGKWKFYLIDLNRMKFKKLSEKEKINNFSSLSAPPEMLEIIAKEYAKLEGWPIEQTITKFKVADQYFRLKRKNKKQIKKLLLKGG